MFPGLQNTVSALISATVSLDTAASNIANSQVQSTPPKAGAVGPVFSPGARAGYAPQRVIQTTTGSGGVRASVVPVSPASLAIYDPASPLSNSEGLVNIPNVSLPVEIAKLREASFVYKANIKVLETLDNSFKTLLKI